MPLSSQGACVGEPELSQALLAAQHCGPRGQGQCLACAPSSPSLHIPTQIARANSSHTSLEPDTVNWIKVVPGEISTTKHLKLT